MKKLLILTASLFSISIGIVPPSYSQDIPGLEYFEMCNNETDHVKLYEFGKTLATGWDYYVKTGRQAKHPVKTKVSFLFAAFTGYIKKFNINEKTELVLYNCYQGYMGIAKNSPTFGSIFQGMIEYLPPAYRAKYLSLPER